MIREPGVARIAGLLLVLLLPVATSGCGGKGSGVTNPTPTPPAYRVVTPPTIYFGENFPARVTAIGDSITAGTEALPYPARLQAILRGRNPEARVITRG